MLTTPNALLASYDVQLVQCREGWKARIWTGDRDTTATVVEGPNREDVVERITDMIRLRHPRPVENWTVEARHSGEPGNPFIDWTRKDDQ